MKLQMASIRLLVWYLRHPSRYPELARIVVRKIQRRLTGVDRLAVEEAAAVAWCEARAVDADEALLRLFGVVPAASVRDTHADVFANGEAAALASPVTMGGPGDLDLIYRVTERIEARTVIETGVAYGWSSLTFLLSLRTRDGRLLSTDLPYPGMSNDPYVGCVVPDELRDRWTLLRGPDRTTVPRAIELAGEVDLCHYDSDKSYRGRMSTCQLLWSALRAGGILMSDDIGDNLGFRDFAASVGVDPLIVRSGNKFVGIQVKP